MRLKKIKKCFNYIIQFRFFHFLMATDIKTIAVNPVGDRIITLFNLKNFLIKRLANKREHLPSFYPVFLQIIYHIGLFKTSVLFYNYWKQHESMLTVFGMPRQLKKRVQVAQLIYKITDKLSGKTAVAAADFDLGD